MSRIHKLATGALAVLFIASTAAERCEAQETNSNNSLRVTVKPSQTDVHLGEHFNLALRVENPTLTNQDVRVWFCSWRDNWQISNPGIYIGGNLICEFNPPITETIPAGGAIKYDLEVYVHHPVSITEHANKLSFQMGFRPIGSKTVFWSKRVAIKVFAIKVLPPPNTAPEPTPTAP